MYIRTKSCLQVPKHFLLAFHHLVIKVQALDLISFEKEEKVWLFLCSTHHNELMLKMYCYCSVEIILDSDELHQQLAIQLGKLHSDKIHMKIQFITGLNPEWGREQSLAASAFNRNHITCGIQPFTPTQHNCKDNKA